MAITATTVFQGQHTFVADIKAADADTGELLINHGLNVPANLNGGVPLFSRVTSMIACTLAANPGFSITTLSATQVGVTKGLGGVGSGGGVPGTTVIGRVVVQMPHSIQL